MNKLPDREKMRREYLCEKATVGALEVFGFGATVIFGILTLGCVFLAYYVLWASLIPIVIVSLVFGVLVFAWMTFLANRVYKTNAARNDRLPYVAPVHEQIATMPAEEVLLRGSEASTATSEELLRPAGKQETKTEELLRAASVGE